MSEREKRASNRPSHDVTAQPPPARPRDERRGHGGPIANNQHGARSERSVPRVSQAAKYALLDWMKYQNDNTYYQHGAPQATNPYFNPQAMNLAYRPPPQRQHPSVPRLPDQQQPFSPRASNFQTGQRSVNAHKHIPSHRVDKHSRYNLRDRNAEQNHPHSTRVADRVVESIEPHEPIGLGRGSTPPWRSGRARRSTPRFSTPLRDDPERPVTPPPAPEVSAYYLAQAQADPEVLKSARKLLVVLDLNGTLLVRGGLDRRQYTERPGLDDLVKYLFANHAVMICTSAKSHNARTMVDALFTDEQRNKIITIRPRQMLGLTPKQFNAKVQVYKNLNDIWADPKVKASVAPDDLPWSMANTVLLDDSVIKAAGQPHNLIHIPEFVQYEEPPASMPNRKRHYRDWTETQEAIMMSVIDRLEQLKMQENVACLIRQWQEGNRPAPGAVDETIDDHTIDEAKPEVVKHVRDTEARGRDMEPVQKRLQEGLQQQADHEAAKGYPTPNSDEPSSSESDEEGVKLKPVPQTKGTEYLRSPRSPSPVTEEHFQFLKLE